MKNIELSGEQRQQLQLALIDAFPTTATLEQMLSFGLNKNLRAIAGEGSLQDIVFRLIQVAESQGWLQDLIRAALESNPGNAILRDVAQDLMQNYLKTPFNSSFRFVLFPRQGNNEASISAKHYRIRQALLKQVNLEIESRINTSLHNRVYVVLDIEQNLDKIELPWESEIKVANKPKILLKNTNIITVFDQPDIQGRLLILGQPGSGKTTMLLKLAEALVSRANDDPTYPVPLLFPLSSWKSDNQNIKDWLVNQLNDKYGLRKDISKQWVENQDIIPLLDGLDEIAAERQEKCVLKINEFLHPSNWNTPVIVCSRIQEYESYKTLLQLNNSLELYPFSPQQVRQYLENTGYSELCNSIIYDADLSQLAKTPLLLNIIVLSAQEISIQIWQKFKSSEERLSYLFDAYIRRMFKRAYKGKGKQPKEKNTKRWLSFLAARLIEESTAEFLIEKMQPDWLKNRFQENIYNLIVLGVIVSLGVGLSVGLIGGLIGVLGVLIRGRFGRLLFGLELLIIGLIIGLIVLLIFGLMGVLTENKIQTIEISLKQFSNGLIKGLIRGLIKGLIFGLIIGLIGGLIFGLIIGLIGGLIDGLIFELIDGMIKGLIFGLIIGLIGGLIGGLTEGLTGGLTEGLAEGTNRLEFENKNFPNQGIQQSFINTINLSAFTSLLTVLIIFIIEISLKYNINNQVLISSLALGIFFGMLIGIPTSGIPVIKHFILRVILWSSGYSPWNYAQFLDYCTNRLFLQRVGGSYRFMHDLLRQHFAKSYSDIL